MKDAFELARFLPYQQLHYAHALAELTAGRKQTHWMWFMFPQLKGLGTSYYAQHFGLSGRAEGEAYLAHPVLGARLHELSGVLLQLPGNDALALMGSPDNLKLRSSMTLFAALHPTKPVFAQVLDKYFNGQPDPATLRLLDS